MPKDTHIQEQAKKIWAETRKKLVTLGHQTVEMAKKGEEEVLRYTEISRLKWDILVLKRKMDDLYSRLGKKTYELAGKGKINQADIKELYNQITKLLGQTKDKDKEITQAKKKNYIKPKTKSKPKAKPKNKAKTKKKA